MSRRNLMLDEGTTLLPAPTVVVDAAGSLQVDPTVSLPSSCKTALKTVLKNCALSAMDFGRIFCIYQTLAARYAQQLFITLKQYDKAPSREQQESWVAGVPLFASTFLMTIITKTVNYYYKNRHQKYIAMQDYIISLFSSAIVFFILDLLSSTGTMAPMNLKDFIITSGIGVIAAAAMFFKLVMPDSSDACLFSESEGLAITRFAEISQRFDHATCLERILNGITGVAYAASASIFIWEIKREINNETTPSSTREKIGLNLFYVMSGVLSAWTVTDHPKSFHVFVILCKFVLYAAVTYAVFSGITFFAIKYHDDKHQFQISDFNRYALICSGMILSLVQGIFSATHIAFPFADNREANQRIENGIKLKLFKTRSICSECCDEKPDDIEARLGYYDKH